jgi:glucosamine-6-phosphate isomerase
MTVFITESYKELSQKSATDVLKKMNERADPLICVASGDTPAGLYKELVTLIREQKIDVSRWSFVGLDEWMGMNGDDEGSCGNTVREQLFQPLQIKKDRIFFFDGKTPDPETACKNAEKFIASKGGIDIAILGLGLNGHIGMNEPGTPASSRTHIAELDTLTQKTGQKYFKTEQELSRGLTLGLETLLEAKNILLLVSGQHKAGIVKQMLQGEISEEIPASLLREHSGLIVYLDKAAASEIQSACE